MGWLTKSHNVFILSLLYISIGTFVVLWHFTPMYHTNDDVWRAMRVHGYGVFNEPSYHILYSNVVWGWLLYQLPADVGGLIGYDVVFMGLYVISLWMITYILLRVTRRFTILLVPPLFAQFWLVEPQFTTLATALTMVFFFAYSTYSRLKEPWVIIVGTILGFLGAMVRIESFVVVCIIAVVFVGRQMILHQRQAMLSIPILLILVVMGIGIDVYVTSRDESYAQIRELRLAYRPVVDYGVNSYFAARPDQLDIFDIHPVQLDMIQQRLWLASGTLLPSEVQAITASISMIDAVQVYWPQAIYNVSQVFENEHVALLGLGLVMAVYGRSWRGIWMSIALLGILFAIGLLGRSVPLHVSQPLVAFVCMVVAMQTWSSLRRKRIFWVLIIGMVAVIWSQFVTQYEDNVRRVGIGADFRASMRDYGMQDVVLWSGDDGFPSIMIYPLFMRDTDFRAIRYINMNITQVEPGSLYQATEFDFDDYFINRGGLLMIAPNNRLSTLEQYCEKLLGGNFRRMMHHRDQSLIVRKVECMVP
jgi:hypothetical protein